MNLNAIKLKIKAMSLAEEAKIIRKLERGCENSYGFNPIYDHRVKDVRNEARATNLARAYLSGKAYKKVEPYRKPEKEWDFIAIKKRAAKIIKKYGIGETDIAIDKWFLQQ